MDFDRNPIKIKSDYTYEDYKKYVQFSLFRGRYHRFGLWAFYIIYPVIILGVTILAFTLEYDPVLIGLDALAILIFFGFIFYTNYISKKYFKTMEKFFSSGVFFEFRNSEFSVSQSNNLYTGQGTIQYEALYRIYETNRMIYIYIAPNEAYLIKKDSVPKEYLGGFRAVLQEKLGKRFVPCR